jgi:hypothetical protein
VRDWFAAADAADVQAGWYTYLFVLNAEGNHAPERPLWIAYYPDPNDGSEWDDMHTAARAQGAVIHQYTSTLVNGKRTLDKNLVLDERWWARWIGGGGTQRRPRTIVEDDEMIVAIPDDTKLCVFRGTKSRFYAISGGVIVHVLFDEPNQSGIPKEVVGDALMAPISQGDLDVLRARTAHTAGVSIDQIP